jgi:hypothetical protein
MPSFTTEDLQYADCIASGATREEIAQKLADWREQEKELAWKTALDAQRITGVLVDRVGGGQPVLITTAEILRYDGVLHSEDDRIADGVRLWVTRMTARP